MLMPSNHSSPPVHYIAGAYPGRIGWLVGPSARTKTKLRPWLPYAMDNDAFSAWTSGKPWSELEWFEMLKWAANSGIKPLWALIPDVVGNKSETLRKWHVYNRCVKWPKAFAVQDGMTKLDVPKDADVVFVGGTDEWKWKTVEMWCGEFPRVHVGRVNGLDRLLLCESYGAESIDGTGWFRDTEEGYRMKQIFEWLEGKVKEPVFDFNTENYEKVTTE